MNITKIPERKQELIFDGQDNNYYTFKVDNIPITQFKNLAEITSIDPSALHTVTADLNVEYLNDFNSYRNKQNKLATEFAIETDRLYIVSTGEKQPGRYQIILEAVYKIHS